MKKTILYSICLFTVLYSCQQSGPQVDHVISADTVDYVMPDTSKIPHNAFGEMVRYGREIMVNTAFYIGPKGISGQYTANQMNCTNCHQLAGTKAYSFNLMRSHQRYPQYRAREGKVITLADRINNCVMRPHNGKPIPEGSKEMTALQCYYRWINEQIPPSKFMRGEKNLELVFPVVSANPSIGAQLYVSKCARCHGLAGEGIMDSVNIVYKYPPLWGNQAYQSGSSMHRVIKQAQWLKANMPFDQVNDKHFVLTDEEAFHLAAFVNDDLHHERPQPLTRDYPVVAEKAIDYDIGPFADHFNANQHKYGPYGPIIAYWKEKGLKPTW